MKKVFSLILISIMLIAFSANVYANNVLDGVLNNENEATTITGNEYENAQKNTQNTQNTTKNNTTKNNTTKDTTTKLPQTGAEDFGVVMLLVVCIGSTIFAYKKVRDYKGI